MVKTRLPYSPEFRRQMVELVRAGRDPDDLAREFEPTYPSGEPHLPFQVKPLSSVLMDDLKVAHKYGGGDGA